MSMTKVGCGICKRATSGTSSEVAALIFLGTLQARRVPVATSTVKQRTVPELGDRHRLGPKHFVIITPHVDQSLAVSTH